MTPDENICTTCEDSGAILYAADHETPVPLDDYAEMLTREIASYSGTGWAVDACPECRRVAGGGESVSEHQRIGEAIGELRAFAAELRTRSWRSPGRPNPWTRQRGGILL